MTSGNRDEYCKLLEKLNVESPGDVDIVLNILNKMSRDQLRALYHFLFPEGSEPDDETRRLIESLKDLIPLYFHILTWHVSTNFYNSF
jgi:hypothetical protein